MNIGLLGGTFNPPHIAHLRIAEEAREACGLDRVIFIPAADPPHKRVAEDVPFAQRCLLVERAIQGNDAFELSLIEGQRPGKSYSIDTIRTVQLQYPADRLYFIIGSDSFLEIGSWHAYGEILRTTSLIVVERPGALVVEPLDALPVAMRGEFRYTPASRRLDHTAGASIQFVAGCRLDISSSMVRRIAAEGGTIRYLVPEAVAAYIREEGMYTRCRQQKKQLQIN